MALQSEFMRKTKKEAYNREARESSPIETECSLLSDHTRLKKFIDKYKSNECLWNTDCKMYRSRKQAINAKKDISAEFGISVSEVKRTIKSLRQRRLRFLKKKFKSGSSPGPKPNWIINRLSFLDPLTKPADGLDNLEICDNGQDGFEENGDAEANETDCSSSLNDIKFNTSVTPMQIVKNHSRLEDQILSKVGQLIGFGNSRSETNVVDRHTKYAEYLADEFRGLNDERVEAIIKHEISKLFMKAKHGVLTPNLSDNLNQTTLTQNVPYHQILSVTDPICLQ